ncbi:MAG: amidohydrolase [Deltaproteobacteria bacterium]|nr:amidohydrolase [Deltaproteobacteria bacterium]MBW2361990.1 amidohydrolase [Deltaproteobacteria bacterium]
MRTMQLLCGVAVALFGPSSIGQAAGVADGKGQVQAHVESRRADYGALAQQIWDLAEVGYQEVESSALLQSALREAGFSVRSGVAGIPTAFVAESGKGGPVIGILAEFDALPGLSQAREPVREPRPGVAAGHACGHHLFGAGSTAAAIAVKDWLDASGTRGTVRLYGTPAEEGGAGKVYLVRDGLFDDVDVVLHWHPADANGAGIYGMLANKSAKFRFRGVSAHAAAAPERARSALDGVEAMNHMANLLREHVPEKTRIHYVITAGGHAPNVTPDFAEVFYYVRHPDTVTLHGIFERLVAAAEGAAQGTGTTMDFEVIHGANGLVPNEALGRALDANLQDVGGVSYTAEERRFAAELQKSFDRKVSPIESAAEVAEFEIYGVFPGSTDVGDVSHVVPTVGFSTAAWVPGTPPHSWQAVASGGTEIGNKAMINAAKTLAMTAIDLFTQPSLIEAATLEHRKRLGPDFQFRSLVGDRAPPLDYRAAASSERSGR